VNVENGVASPVFQVAMPEGTAVSVKDLFVNVPARQKFLKATATEFSHIHDLLFAVGLAYPHVGLRFSHNGRDVFNWKPHKDFDARFKVALGAESLEYTPVNYERGSFSCVGFAGLPEHAKPMAKQFVTFVNGRLVRDKVIRAGVLQAYTGLMMKGFIPSAVIFVQVDASWIDVNVHPSKTELRFRDAGAVQDLVSIAIQNSVKASLAAQSSPQQHLSDESLFFPRARFATAPQAEPAYRAQSQSFQPSQASQQVRFPHVSNLSVSRSAHENKSNQQELLPAVSSISRPLFVEPTCPFAHAQYLGQYKNCYLLLESQGELWVIDQHAFHERILFEEILRNSKSEDSIGSQQLLAPILVPVPTSVGVCVGENTEEFTKLGFQVELLNPKTVAIHAYPALIGPERVVPVFEDIVARMVAILGVSTSDVHPLVLRARELQTELQGLTSQSRSLSQESVYHLFYATMACHSAVRAGEALNAELVRRLLQRAGDVDFYAHCPHGRPVWRKFTEADVAMWFSRI
jgi:DNA mismatch repair protein MutL